MKRSKQQGELESAVMDALWRTKKSLTSGQILEKLNGEDDLALTTVLTVLSRLMEKDMVLREPGEGRSHLYRAKQSKAEYTASLMLSLVSESNNPALAFSHFANGLTAAQQNALRKSLEK
jgi:predicted transcriptional regulator